MEAICRICFTRWCHKKEHGLNQKRPRVVASDDGDTKPGQKQKQSWFYGPAGRLPAPSMMVLQQKVKHEPLEKWKKIVPFVDDRQSCQYCNSKFAMCLMVCLNLWEIRSDKWLPIEHSTCFYGRWIFTKTKLCLLHESNHPKVRHLFGTACRGDSTCATCSFSPLFA